MCGVCWFLSINIINIRRIQYSRSTYILVQYTIVSMGLSRSTFWCSNVPAASIHVRRPMSPGSCETFAKRWPQDFAMPERFVQCVRHRYLGANVSTCGARLLLRGSTIARRLCVFLQRIRVMRLLHYDTRSGSSSFTYRWLVLKI